MKNYFLHHTTSDSIMFLIGCIFLLLDGTLGHPATKTQVRYDGPDKVLVSQDSDDRITLPEGGSPSFKPNVFHNGANFFFNSHVIVPGEAKTKIEEDVVVPPSADRNQPPSNLVPEITFDEIIESVPVVETITTEAIPEPSYPINEDEIVSQEPTPEVIKLEPLPILPPAPEIPPLTAVPYGPLPVLVQEQANTPFLCEDVEIIPDIPLMIEPIAPELVPEFNVYSGMQPVMPGLVPEFNVHIRNIPAPVLPHVFIPEVSRNYFLEEPKYIELLPPGHQFTSFYPPSVKPAALLSPLDCAQNIVLERVLPNMGFEYGKASELLSFPKRPPVVSSVIYP